MKKIMLLILIATLLSACRGSKETMPLETSQGNLIRLNIKTDIGNRHFQVVEFGYCGHDYIMFSDVVGSAVVHHPDCNCQNE